MTAPLVQRLSLVVDAATGTTETRMDALAAASRQAGEAATRSAGQVAAAADRVAAAQAKRDDAADRVTLAERKLTEAQEKYAADSSQVLAAEQRLESSRRGLHTATRQVEGATEQLEQAQNEAREATARAATEQEQAGDQARRFGGDVDGLTQRVAAFAAGYSIGDWARDAVTGFLNGARGAQTLATSMNATIAQGGQLSSLFSSLGLEASDLLEIQAEFAQKIEANANALSEFGAEVKMNEDGTTNWALTLVDALTQLQKIPDATERNRRGFALFGEEGYKQLSRLLNSGVSVEEALRRIGTPFSEEDVRATQRYDDALSKLQLAGGGLQRELGAELLPAITAITSGLGDVVDVVGAVPGEMTAAATAVVLLALAKRSAAAEGGLLAGALVFGQGAAMRFTGAVAAATTGTGALATTMGVATVAGRGLLTVLGGPIGVAILALGAGFAFLNSRTDENEEAAQKSAEANRTLAEALQQSNGVITASVRSRAALSLQQDGLLTTAEKTGVAFSQMTAGLLGNQEAYDATRQALEEYAVSLEQQANGEKLMGTATDEQVQAMYGQAEAVRNQIGKYETLHGTVSKQVEQEKQLAAATDGTTDKQQLATAAMDSLRSAMDQGGVSAQDLTALTKTAAETQVEQARAAAQADAAIAAYRATTDQAVQATLDLVNSQLALENAEYGYLDALDQLRAARDDAKTSVDEVAQAHTRYKAAALDAAKAAGDAAVEAATLAGQVLGPLEEANLRADTALTNLREKLNRPGLSERARTDLQGLVDTLQAARDRQDVTAIVTLTGATEAAGKLDETVEAREAFVDVSSRGGPAVIRYLDGIASAERLALIRTESRNGPAVEDYLNGLARERLAIIRVETRGGPAVERYLDDLAGRPRSATIDVKPGAAPSGGGGFGAGLFGAPLGAGQVTVQVFPQVEMGGRLTPGAAVVTGRQVVQALREYERQNGTGWRRD